MIKIIFFSSKIDFFIYTEIMLRFELTEIKLLVNDRLESPMVFDVSANIAFKNEVILNLLRIYVY